ncbi:MAG: VOC family protein [Planctomycetota bacterium]
MHVSKVNPVPEGARTVTPHLVVKGAMQAIEFYKKAFGAIEHFHMPGPGGAVMHAEIQIGDSLVYLADEFPNSVQAPATLGGTSVVIHLYVEDADATFKQAVAAGADVRFPVMDTFWGDRYGQVADPFGHTWAIATHVKDMTPEEIGAAAEEFMKNMGEECGGQG